MKKKIGYSVAIIIFANILVASPLLSQAVKEASGCSDCNYCRMSIEGVDMTKIKELSKEIKSEVKAAKHGMITVTSLSDKSDIAMYQDYRTIRQEKMQQLDKGENTKACKCCSCFERANARISGIISEEVIPYKDGTIELITSQDKEEVKKLHERVEKVNKAMKEK
jgi:hypothetical protein